MAKPSKLRIGLAQMASTVGDVQANMKAVRRFVAQAREKDVQLLVFPELAMSGYDIGSEYSNASLRMESEEVEELRSLSQDLSMVVGLIEETESVEFYNTAVFLSDGEIRYVHRKVYPPNYRIFKERSFFGVGWGVGSFLTPWGRMAMLICGDAWHLALPYLAAHDGANVLIVIAASSWEGLTPNIDPRGSWERMNQSYGLTLSTFVVFANRAGQEGRLNFWGGSHVVQPDGRILAQAKIGEPDLLVVDLDMSQLRRQRLILPFRRDDRLELTLDMGRRIQEAKCYRRDGLLHRLVRYEEDDTNSGTVADRIVERGDTVPPTPEPGEPAR